MSEEEKKKPIAFNSENPLTRRREDNTHTTRKRKRTSPFYRPEPIKRTAEELKAIKEAKKKQQLAMKIRIKSGNYDPFTEMVANLLILWSAGLSKFYIARYQLWNSMAIEGLGLSIYYIFLSIFQSTIPLILALIICSITSFSVKFVLYKLWLFKKAIKIGKKKKSSNSDNST